MAYENKYTSANAPSWWVGKVTSGRTPQDQYNMVANAIIPFLSPEDRAAVASNLYRSNQADFAEYRNVATPKAGYQVSNQEQNYFTSADRARQASETLNKLMTSTGAKESELGPGFAYLSRIIAIMNKYGGETYQDPTSNTMPPTSSPGGTPRAIEVPGGGIGWEITVPDPGGPDINGKVRLQGPGDYVGAGPRRQTRRDYLQMMGELDPLLAEGKSEGLAAYEPLVQKLVQPFFSGGKVVPVSKNQSGNWVFGTARKEWF